MPQSTPGIVASAIIGSHAIPVGNGRVNGRCVETRRTVENEEGKSIEVEIEGQMVMPHNAPALVHLPSTNHETFTFSSSQTRVSKVHFKCSRRIAVNAIHNEPLHRIMNLS